MSDHVLERRCWLPRARDVVFALIADPGNLLLTTPAWARPRWLAPPPARLETGAVLDFAVMTLGVTSRWRVMIREFDPPYRFVDVQLRGPFARWEHRHRFLEGPARPGTSLTGTWVEDRVTYRLPGGSLGRLAHALLLRGRIRACFAHRDARLRDLLGGALPPVAADGA